MSSERMADYTGSRSINTSGDCLNVTLPKKELRENGYDVDSLAEDRVRCKLVDNVYTIVLPE